jgi:CheY-like chemotaxis protein
MLDNAEVPKAVLLCVDDEPIALSLRTLILEKAGYEVIPASSGGEGMEILQSREIDLVLTDFLMPSMIGTDFAKQIKAKNPSMPVLLLSGINELPPDAQIADKFLSKLIGADGLLEEVANLLESKGSTSLDQTARPN